MTSELEGLKAKLVQEISKGQKAAEYGLQLVEENSLLKKDRCDYLQQIHTLSGRLESKRHVEKDQACELEIARDTIEKLQKKLNKHDTECHRKVADLIETRERLVSECSEKGSTVLTLTKKCELLEVQLTEASNKLQQSYMNESITDSFEQKVLYENQILLDTKMKLEAKLLEMEEELFRTQEREKKLKEVLEENKETLADLNKELSSCSIQIRKAHEENDDLQAEVESLKMEQIDVNKRGNSLFSEVEDNRKFLEDEVKSLRSQKRVLFEKNEFNEQEMGKLKRQIAILLSMTNQQADMQYVQKLDQALSKARGEVQELTFKLERSEEKRKSLEIFAHSPVEVKSLPIPLKPMEDDQYNFFHTIINEKDAKIRELQMQMDSYRFTKTTLSNKMMTCERQLYHAEKKSAALQTEIVKLKLELEEMRSKDNQTKKPVSRQITVVEKIPGFNIQPKPNDCSTVSSQTLFEDKKEVKISKTMQELRENENLTAYDKENNPKLLSGNLLKTEKSNVIQQKKAQTKKVTIMETETMIDHCDEKELPKRSVHRKGGRKADVQSIMVSSEDAIDPADCKQQ